LDKEFGIIRECITNQEKENLKISKANVGWHLDHSLKVVNNVLESLKNSNSDDYKKNFNGMRLFAFTMGFFPRGKAKAPKRVLPPEVLLKEDIENLILQKEEVEALKTVSILRFEELLENSEHNSHFINSNKEYYVFVLKKIKDFIKKNKP